MRGRAPGVDAAERLAQDVLHFGGEAVVPEHPLQVVAGPPRQLAQRLALVLAETERRLAGIVPAQLARRVEEGVVPRIANLVQCRGVARKVFVPLELRIEDIERGVGVGQGVVGAFQLAPAIETQRRREMAGLLEMEDPHRVEEASAREIQLATAALDLSLQQGQVETDHVEAQQVGAGQQRLDARPQLGEPRRVTNILVANAVHRRGARRDGAFGIDEARESLPRAVRFDPHQRQLDDAVFPHVCARGLEVEADERALEVQVLHGPGMMTDRRLARKPRQPTAPT